MSVTSQGRLLFERLPASSSQPGSQLGETTHALPHAADTSHTRVGMKRFHHLAQCFCITRTGVSVISTSELPQMLLWCGFPQ